jgi:hypothetical protein
MNREQFIQLLEEPLAHELSNIQWLVDQFPYFQTARLLCLKILHDEKHIDYSSQLKIAAAYAGDRKKLFELMHKTVKPKVELTPSNSVAIEKTPAENFIGEKTADAQIPVEELPVIPEVNEEKISPADVIQIRLREIMSSKKKEDEKAVPEAAGGPEVFIERTEAMESETVKTEDATVLLKEEITQPVQEAVSEQKPESLPSSLTFIQWLKLASEKKITDFNLPSVAGIESVTPLQTAEQRQENTRLIEKFLHEEPKIDPAKTQFYSPENMARNSVIDHDDIVSETLARVYYDQGHFNRAIRIFEVLSLNFPDKSSYFASLIQKIKEEAGKEAGGNSKQDNR